MSGLRKSFGSTVALDGLDLEVQTGQVHGFLGPNGAGKTTTIRILLGLVRADAGSVTLLGGDPWSDVETLHRRLAYVPGDVTLWPSLTGGEVIDLLGRLRGSTDTARRNALIERFELDPTKKGRTYSKGNRQKVALVAALASDVELLLLDEPTSGLDPLMDAVFRSAVEDVRREGRTVLLSSHILSEVEALADHVSIIRAAAPSRPARWPTCATSAGPASTPSSPTRHPALLEGIPGVEDLTTDGSRVAFTVDTARVGEVLARLGQHGIQSLTCQPPTLEQLFLKEYVSTPEREEVRA